MFVRFDDRRDHRDFSVVGGYEKLVKMQETNDNNIESVIVLKTGSRDIEAKHEYRTHHQCNDWIYVESWKPMTMMK